MDKAIVDLLESLEFARSQDASTLHMNYMYGEQTEDNLGAMIDAAVAAFRSDQEFEDQMDRLRDALQPPSTNDFKLHQWVEAQQTRNVMAGRTGGWQRAQVVAIEDTGITVKFERDGDKEKMGPEEIRPRS